MDASYKRHSRRSHPDLHNLAITPLSASYPLSPGADDLHSTTTPTTQASYIAARTPPPIPSILSRSPSRTRRPSGKSTLGLIALANSSAAAASRLPNSHLPNSRLSKSGTATPTTRPRVRESDSTDWLLQTASALVASAAEAKGQTWLAARASSTSLEIDGFGAAAYNDRQDAPYGADDEFSPVSTRLVSRPGSRFGSRANSRMQSRRGSRVGVTAAMAELGSLTPLELRVGGEEEVIASEVDFVDDDAEGWREIEEDGEVKRLVWGRAKGWVDWAVGWMDFREDEDENEDEDQDVVDTEHGKEKGNAFLRDQVKETRRRRRATSARIPVDTADGLSKDIRPPPADGQGALSDAAWLLGVAKNILV